MAMFSEPYGSVCGKSEGWGERWFLEYTKKQVIDIFFYHRCLNEGRDTNSGAEIFHQRVAHFFLKY